MDIQKLTAVSLGKKIKEKELSVREALEASFAQIDQTESQYHAYVTIDREGAYRQADAVQEKIDKGELTGPLAGVPVAIKDNMCTKGLLTTCSSKILEKFIFRTYTATAIENLINAGCVVIGKTNMDEVCDGKHNRNFILWCDGKTHTIQSMFQVVLQVEVQRQLHQMSVILHLVPIQVAQSVSHLHSVVSLV